MKVFVDIIHPANVHYFKNFIKEMQRAGHKVYITARNKDVTLKLLEAYGMKYFNMGKGRIGRGSFGKLLYLIYAELLTFFYFLRIRPNCVISFASIPAAHNCFLFRIPHISFDDTEHNRINRLLYKPFTAVIFTPQCFLDDLGPKQIRFPGYMELFYLHPSVFTPDPSIVRHLGVNPGEKYVVVRFVSWDAFHDIGQHGFDYESKIKLVRALVPHVKVFISAEGDLPPELEQYRILISPEKMHDVLAYATLFIGEGATMASECAALGVPAIYVNSLELGYLKEQERKYGLVFNYRTSEGITEKALELVKEVDDGASWKNKQKNLLREMIDPTRFLVWFVQDYPYSLERLRSTPDVFRNFDNQCEAGYEE